MSPLSEHLILLSSISDHSYYLQIFYNVKAGHFSAFEGQNVVNLKGNSKALTKPLRAFIKHRDILPRRPQQFLFVSPNTPLYSQAVPVPVSEGGINFLVTLRVSCPPASRFRGNFLWIVFLPIINAGIAPGFLSRNPITLFCVDKIAISGLPIGHAALVSALLTLDVGGAFPLLF